MLQCLNRNVCYAEFQLAMWPSDDKHVFSDPCNIKSSGDNAACQTPTTVKSIITWKF